MNRQFLEEFGKLGMQSFSEIGRLKFCAKAQGEISKEATEKVEVAQEVEKKGGISK